MATAHMHLDGAGQYAPCARSEGLGLGTIWGDLRPMLVCFCPCSVHDIAGYAAFNQEVLESGQVTSMAELSSGGPTAEGYRYPVAAAVRGRASGLHVVLFDVYHLARRPAGSLPARRLSTVERNRIIAREVANARAMERR